MDDFFEKHVPTERLNIPKLLDRLRRFDDRAAGDEVLKYYIDCYAKRVFYYIRSLGPNENDAQDICQETFLSFSQALKENFTPGNQELAFLCEVARNKVRDMWRRQKRTPVTCSIDAETENIQDNRERPDMIVSNREEEEELRLAISALPKNQRQIIQFRFYEGMNIEEIRREIGVKSTGTVFYRLKRTIDNLRKRLNRALEGESS